MDCFLQCPGGLDCFGDGHCLLDLHCLFDLQAVLIGDATPKEAAAAAKKDMDKLKD